MPWKQCLLALALGGLGAATMAQSQASGGFQIHIRLNTPGTPAAESGAHCETQTVASAPNALVRVVCGDGRFVSIAPDPRKPFVGSHGGAYRFHLQPGATVGSWLDEGVDTLWWGRGTVTAMRIYGVPRDGDAPLEMMVSF